MLDMTYASYEGRTLKLDLYKPREKLGKLPAIVCIHGGGWAKGSRKNYTKVAQALATHGYVAVTISYRLSGEAIFPAAIVDCKAAVRFLRLRCGGIPNYLSYYFGREQRSTMSIVQGAACWIGRDTLATTSA